MGNLNIYNDNDDKEYKFTYEYTDKDGYDVFMPIDKEFIDKSIYEKIVINKSNPDTNDYLLIPLDIINKIISALKTMTVGENEEQIFAEYLYKARAEIERKLDRDFPNKREILNSYDKILKAIKDF